MQINRRQAKGKDVVYEVSDGKDIVIRGIVDTETRVLHIVTEQTPNRQAERAIKQLVAKAKARDGIPCTEMHWRSRYDAEKDLILGTHPETWDEYQGRKEAEVIV